MSTAPKEIGGQLGNEAASPVPLRQPAPRHPLRLMMSGLGTRPIRANTALPATHVVPPDSKPTWWNSERGSRSGFFVPTTVVASTPPMQAASGLPLAALIMLFACARSEPNPPSPGTETCVVQRIGDGDSLTCEGGRRVRLLLVDAPELAQREPGQQAQRALTGLAPKGTRLRLELDVQPADTHGRTLAYAYLPDGRMVNEELARQGMVVTLTYPPNVRHVERIQAAVETARRSRRGLWATDAFRCLPRDFRGGRCGEGGGRRR